MSREQTWRPIADAPLNDMIVMGYFGPAKHMFGAGAVGRFFQWECMDAPLASGWPFGAYPPTHFFPLPEPPVQP